MFRVRDMPFGLRRPPPWLICARSGAAQTEAGDIAPVMSRTDYFRSQRAGGNGSSQDQRFTQ